MAKRKKRTQGRGRVLIRSVLIGTGVMLASVVLLAFSVYLGWLPESAISVGNTVSKILTALAAGLAVGLSRIRVPWYFGGIAAVITLLISIVGMSLYLGTFRVSWNLVADLLMSFAIGAAAAAALNRKNAQ